MAKRGYYAYIDLAKRCVGKKIKTQHRPCSFKSSFPHLFAHSSFCPLIFLPIHVFAANRKRGHCALSDKQNVPLFVSRQNLINPVRPSEALGLAKGGNGKARTLCSFRLGKKMCGQKIKTQHRPCSFKSSFPHLFAHPCFCPSMFLPIHVFAAGESVPGTKLCLCYPSGP